MDQALQRDRPVTLNVPDNPAIIRPEREAAETVDDDEGVIGALARRCSPLVARWAARNGLTPDAVAAVSLAAAVMAAVWFSAGTRGGMASGALLLCASYVLGRSGGAVPGGGHGGWPAAVLARAGEYCAYAGLAAGAAAPGGAAWWAATALVALLSVRDAAAGSFTLVRARPPGTAARRAWNCLGLPPGERVALTAVTAALGGARLTFAVLLAWGSAATAAAVAGRLGRSPA